MIRTLLYGNAVGAMAMVLASGYSASAPLIYVVASVGIAILAVLLSAKQGYSDYRRRGRRW